MKTLFFGFVSLISLVGPTLAEAPRVAADIAPVHSLVARVMQGVATPDLLIQANETPHDFSLRPSAARTMQQADMVFWVGHILTPRLEDSLSSIATSAIVIELSEVEGTRSMAFRTNALFVEEEDHHDHEEHDNEHAHDHGEGMDPHMWLDPVNAAVWVDAIAGALAEFDPDNARLYAENASEARKELRTLTEEISQRLAPAANQPFVVFHDAYHYFEDRFGLQAAGALLVADGGSPSAARLQSIRQAISETGVTCVFSEPQFDPRVIQSVVSSGFRTAELDPMGIGIEPGPGLYPALLQNMSKSMATCLKG